MRNILRSLALAVSFLVVLSGMTGCGVSKIKDIEVTSFGVESYSMRGLRSIEAVVAIGIDNPAMSFTVTDVKGLVKHNGQSFASYTADSVTVAGRCAKVYDLSCTATLSDGVSFMQILSIAGSRSLEGFTTDVEARVRLKSGASKKFKFKNLDIQEMIE